MNLEGFMLFSCLLVTSTYILYKFTFLTAGKMFIFLMKFEIETSLLKILKDFNQNGKAYLPETVLKVSNLVTRNL